MEVAGAAGLRIMGSAAMHPTDPKPLGDYFEEGVQARLDGRSLHDNPYAAGSPKRREWNAGFCATAERDDGDDTGVLDPGLRGPGRRRDE